MSLVTTSGSHMRELLAQSIEMIIGSMSALSCLPVAPKTPNIKQMCKPNYNQVCVCNG